MLEAISCGFRDRLSPWVVALAKLLVKEQKGIPLLQEIPLGLCLQEVRPTLTREMPACLRAPSPVV